jgi:UDP-GlcNAc3NAcA epimerase
LKIVTVLGARPQFIKASVVSVAIAEQANMKEIMVHTGQHYDENMSDIFFAELGIAKPKYNLEINGGGHGAMTGRMLIEVEKVFLTEKPDVVLVYGDTNSTFAGALAAVKLHIPVAHVEAGMRSFNMRMPEEVNRILTDRISHWLFAPTTEAVENLKHEGIAHSCIHNVGDVMYDVALHHGRRVHKLEGSIKNKLRMEDRSFVLVTVHRAENTDNPVRLSTIVQALIKITETMPVVWPMHPRTRDVLVRQGLLDELSAEVKVIEPQGYLDMVSLEQTAAVIATDSGGVQKEAFFHSVPCVTLREETEWVELVESGWNCLAPPQNANTLVDAILARLGNRGQSISPYGEGKSALSIVKLLMQHASA